MCGISGIVDLSGRPVPDLSARLAVMDRMLTHRGPDDNGTWEAPDGSVGLEHRRLSILDLSSAGHQPMHGANGTVLTYNGEVYNYLELREALAPHWDFASRTDSETILAAYARHGMDAVDHLRGMFAFAIWDPSVRRLFAARDRFGIKPFYYAVVDGVFHFASEAKALLPFLPDIETDPGAFAEYVTFQFTTGEQTLFKGIRELPPGHALVIEDGEVRTWRYWDLSYEVDFDHSEDWFHARLAELLDESVALHLRSDVPVGAYVSGGIDSSLMAMLANRADAQNHQAFHGRFMEYPGYDESSFARLVTDRTGGTLHIADMTAQDFSANIRDTIYHLDFPVAGPGSFPQYMVSKLASENVKVVLGGQGGDEIFGGYARYLVAYLEQCLKAGIEGTYRDGSFVVTLESIIPNLTQLQEYKPMIRQFWRDGLFEDLDDRYFRLIDRSNDMGSEVERGALDFAAVRSRFDAIFNNRRNVQREAYLNSMTHFDLKCSLPALLQVEDRMSMAHGLESRVPMLDHPLIEFVATVPANVKFQGGRLKHMLKETYRDALPVEIADRRDKMGFPVPLKEWMTGTLKDFREELYQAGEGRDRPFLNRDAVMASFDSAAPFSRKTWGLLSLEIWHQTFHDRAAEWRNMAQGI
jgi:asparagine synthase (glutamine-hydrolysing)